MYQTLDDTDLDDDALWAVIDSAAAASSSSLTSVTKPNKPLTTPTRFHSPKITFPVISKSTSPSPSPLSTITNPRKHSLTSSRDLLPEESSTDHRQKKFARFSISETTSPPSPVVVGGNGGDGMVKYVQRTPTTPPNSSYCSEYQIQSPVMNCDSDSSVMTHSLSGRFPTVALFKEYQNAAMAILEKGDYTTISGNPYIKKSGWRKISFYFNISYEIKDKTIEFDDNRNVQRAEFIVRAHMQGGRFSDGWGSCEKREKRFMKPNHDIPSTAETRAKNKACQDLLGIGEYRPGVHAQK